MLNKVREFGKGGSKRDDYEDQEGARQRIFECMCHRDYVGMPVRRRNRFDIGDRHNIPRCRFDPVAPLRRHQSFRQPTFGRYLLGQWLRCGCLGRQRRQLRHFPIGNGWTVQDHRAGNLCSGTRRRFVRQSRDLQRMEPPCSSAGNGSRTHPPLRRPNDF